MSSHTTSKWWSRGFNPIYLQNQSSPQLREAMGTLLCVLAGLLRKLLFPKERKEFLPLSHFFLAWNVGGRA